ncbi:hypothetical protein FF125_18210 [Aureibaculum algae]|uniref:Uncharacterized protein n=1 Tax=Aureibaculum algae TaxID=2584122 RepID=A0A5B7TZS7_9FLAO|nr:hypothetical protein [Aureibaculum algae]QCX40287.1 hypothetical protein FF125_18210 [Aureibaculum algae]
MAYVRLIGISYLHLVALPDILNFSSFIEFTFRSSILPFFDSKTTTFRLEQRHKARPAKNGSLFYTPYPTGILNHTKHQKKVTTKALWEVNQYIELGSHHKISNKEVQLKTKKGEHSGYNK